MDSASLQQKLTQIDGRGYKAYGQIRGAYRFPRFTLFVDYVQGDPFATPSRLRVRVAQADAGFDARLFENQARCVALEDFIARAFSAAIGRIVQGNRGTGKSGFMGVDRGGQEILERTAALVTDRFVEVRFVAGLPADGRRCLGREAAAMLLDELPRLVDASLFLKALDPGAVYGHVEAAEDQEWLRGQLQEKHLVAFVADGRELVACRDDAVKIRAEDGRRVEKVDISPFIDQVSNLYREHGVSTVLVMGGSGEYFEVADTVIAMENYEPRVVTGQAREIAAARKSIRRRDGGGGFGPLRPRVSLARGLNPRRGRKDKVAAKGLRTILCGREMADLTCVEQLIDRSQTRAIGDMVWCGLRQGYFDGESTLTRVLDRLLADVRAGGLDVISPHRQGTKTLNARIWPATTWLEAHIRETTPCPAASSWPPCSTACAALLSGPEYPGVNSGQGKKRQADNDRNMQ